MSADLASIPAVRATRLVILALVAIFLVSAPGPARASGPVAKNDAKAIATLLAKAPMKATAAASCSSLKRKAGRYKRGSAKRRHYLRRYKKCRARARKPPASERTPSTPAPLPTPTAPLTGPVYLPSIFPNPNGYRSGGGCQPGYERTYLLAGFSCQYAGYNNNLGSPGSPVWAPVYLLFGVWYCADQQFRFRC